LEDKEHNRKVRKERENRSPARDGTNLKIELWGVWDKSNRNVVQYCNGFPQAIQTRVKK
jgi:hypothetical protein